MIQLTIPFILFARSDDTPYCSKLQIQTPEDDLASAKMRLSTVAPIALTMALFANAAPGTLGFALGTKMPDGKCKTTADYEADFDAIAAGSSARIIRGYAAADCDSAKNMLPAAKSKSFKVVLGIWPDVQESYDKDRNAIAQYAPQYKDQVWGVTVGSETLYRKNFTGDVLASKMTEVKNQLKGQFRIGTADTYNRYADGYVVRWLR